MYHLTRRVQLCSNFPMDGRSEASFLRVFWYGTETSQVGTTAEMSREQAFHMITRCVRHETVNTMTGDKSRMSCGLTSYNGAL